MSAELGYGRTPGRATGWDGSRGDVPIQGPTPKPKGAGITTPKRDEIAIAEVSTSWNCHACGEYNDISGEGAVDSWMECAHCHAHSWLVME